MSLSRGTRFGPYEIVALVGKGGMGEVYRALDTRLDRAVAIKVLSERDPERQERFKREAKAVSSLSHPHICTLHDVGEERGEPFLVMEFLEGETLEARLRKGRLSLKQALEFAVQIADALEKAHQQGVVHRDLKPGNIMVTKSGVKLLDFGLAKLKSRGPSESTDLPTRDASGPLTQEGTILGTLQYMAPEQLEGQEADARTDIFAFGAIVYEMVTGAKAFHGKSQASLMGAIMSSQPKPLSELEVMAPRPLEHVVRTCLAKEPDNRWQSAGDVKRDLIWIADASAGVVPAASTPGSRRRSLVAAILAGGLLFSLVTWVLMRPGATESRSLQRFEVTPRTPLLRSAGNLLALSRDGKTLAYMGFPENVGRQLYRRVMDQVEDAPIPDTEFPEATTSGHSTSFFSPDGKWIAFIRNGGLQKVPLAGGPAVTVAQNVFFRGGSWGADDVIVLGSPEAGLLRVSANGGTPTPIVTPAPGEGVFLYPQILPGGREILFTVAFSPDRGHLEILSLETNKRQKLMEGMAGRVVPSGHLVFFRNGSLWAVRFDLSSLTSVGEPIPVVERVRSELEGSFQFAISDEGSLAYIPDPGGPGERSLVWVDSKGQEQPTKATPAPYTWTRISPDGGQAAVQIGDGGAAEIGVVDLESGSLTRLTNRQGFDGYPLWSQDGRRIFFASDREGAVGLFWMTPDGVGPVTRLAIFKDELLIQPHGWSADGKQLVFFYIRGRRVDIGVLSMDGDPAWRPLSETPSVRQTPAVSPDGAWIAYASNESGRDEVYIERFPELGQKRPISNGGGLDPVWSHDGTKLYYYASPPTKMMVVPITTKPAVTVGTAQVLFERSYYRPIPGTRTYSLAKDGTRLLIIKPMKPSNTGDRIHVVLNWFDELRRLLPVDE